MFQIHEYLHGISTRLTGGPDNVGCLWDGEPGGMGEGWGDIFATITRVTVNSTRADVYTMGDYSNGGNGIRKFPVRLKIIKYFKNLRRYFLVSNFPVSCPEFLN